MKLQFCKFYSSEELQILMAIAAYFNPIWANHMHKLGVDEKLNL
jgi:hypothetical protein